MENEVADMGGTPSMEGTVSLDNAQYNDALAFGANDGYTEAETPRGYINEDGTFTDDWTRNFEGADSLSKYKSMGDLVNGFLNANKLIGRKAEPITKPDANATPEQREAWRQHLGIPDNTDSYLIPEGYEDEYDEESFGQFAEWARQHNIPPETVAEFVKYQASLEGDQEATFGDIVEDMGKKCLAQLTETWGGMTEKNLIMVKNGLERRGIDTQAPEWQVALNNPYVLNALYEYEEGRHSGNLPSTALGRENSTSMKQEILAITSKYGSIDRMPRDVRESYQRLISNGNIRW